MAVTIMKVRVGNGPDAPHHQVKGREAWALHELMQAGERGVTPIENPAPRWSHYCWLLRRRGIIVETITESHGGPYSGTHARYRLASLITVLEAA